MDRLTDRQTDSWRDKWMDGKTTDGKGQTDRQTSIEKDR